MLFGKYLISLPWLDYGGPLADSQEIALELAAQAATLAKENDCRFVEHRAVKTPLPGLQATQVEKPGGDRPGRRLIAGPVSRGGIVAGLRWHRPAIFPAGHE